MERAGYHSLRTEMALCASSSPRLALTYAQHHVGHVAHVSTAHSVFRLLSLGFPVAVVG